MLTGKQKQYLKSTAVNFSAVVQIGKEGITDNVINSVTEALAARELIKVKSIRILPKISVRQQNSFRKNRDVKSYRL